MPGSSKTKRNRALLDQYWAASASGDLETEHNIYDENLLCEYPQLIGPGIFEPDEVSVFGKI